MINFLHKFWPEGQGPRKYSMLGKQVSARIGTAIVAAKADLSTGKGQVVAPTIVEDEEYIGTTRSLAKKEALSKAAAKSRASEKRRRTLPLQS